MRKEILLPVIITLDKKLLFLEIENMPLGDVPVFSKVLVYHDAYANEIDFEGVMTQLTLGDSPNIEIISYQTLKDFRSTHKVAYSDFCEWCEEEMYDDRITYPSYSNITQSYYESRNVDPAYPIPEWLNDIYREIKRRREIQVTPEIIFDIATTIGTFSDRTISTHISH